MGSWLFVLAIIAGGVTGVHAAEVATQKVEQGIIEQTNTFRKQHNLPPVKPDKQLTQAAVQFAQWMAKNDKYGHKADGRTPAQRARAAGYQYCVVRENIAYRLNTGGPSVESLLDIFVDGWKESPGHRENMLAEHVTQTGVGVATANGEKFFAVQLFGRPKAASLRVDLTNATDQPQTIAMETESGADEFDLPPRGVLRTRRCYPVTVRATGLGHQTRVAESGSLTLTADGWRYDRQSD